MGRYFFDIHDGTVVEDYEGLELPNDDDAMREAIKSLPTIAAHQIPAGDDRQSFTVIVRGADRRPICTAALLFCGTRL